MKVLLSLDMSTTCTGWASFNIETKELISYGTLKPGKKYNDVRIDSLKYPQQQLYKMIDLAFQIRNLIQSVQPTRIVVEEITGSKQRHGQKVLDGLHWIMLYHNQEYISILEYLDVGGSDGWRTLLQLKLSEADKLANKEAKKLNPKLGRGVPKLPVYNAKDLACRHANKLFKLNLDPQQNQYDADIGDAICVGDAYIKFKCPNN